MALRVARRITAMGEDMGLGPFDMTETISALKAQALRWKCRAYSFAAMPFIAMIAADVLSRGAVLPSWGIGAMALGAGLLGTLSCIASFDHRDLTGKLVWF